MSKNKLSAFLALVESGSEAEAAPAGAEPAASEAGKRSSAKRSSAQRSSARRGSAQGAAGKQDAGGKEASAPAAASSPSQRADRPLKGERAAGPVPHDSSPSSMKETKAKPSARKSAERKGSASGAPSAAAVKASAEGSVRDKEPEAEPARPRRQSIVEVRVKALTKKFDHAESAKQDAPPRAAAGSVDIAAPAVAAAAATATPRKGEPAPAASGKYGSRKAAEPSGAPSAPTQSVAPPVERAADKGSSMTEAPPTYKRLSAKRLSQRLSQRLQASMGAGSKAPAAPAAAPSAATAAAAAARDAVETSDPLEQDKGSLVAEDASDESKAAEEAGSSSAPSQQEASKRASFIGGDNFKKLLGMFGTGAVTNVAKGPEQRNSLKSLRNQSAARARRKNSHTNMSALPANAGPTEEMRFRGVLKKSREIELEEAQSAQQAAAADEEHSAAAAAAAAVPAQTAAAPAPAPPAAEPAAQPAAKALRAAPANSARPASKERAPKETHAVKAGKEQSPAPVTTLAATAAAKEAEAEGDAPAEEAEQPSPSARKGDRVAAVRSMNASPKCTLCDKTVYRMEQLQDSRDRPFHGDCLRCADCIGVKHLAGQMVHVLTRLEGEEAGKDGRPLPAGKYVLCQAHRVMRQNHTEIVKGWAPTNVVNEGGVHEGDITAARASVRKSLGMSMQRKPVCTRCGGEIELSDKDFIVSGLERLHVKCPDPETLKKTPRQGALGAPERFPVVVALDGAGGKKNVSFVFKLDRESKENALKQQRLEPVRLRYTPDASGHVSTLRELLLPEAPDEQAFLVTDSKRTFREIKHPLSGALGTTRFDDSTGLLISELYKEEAGVLHGMHVAVGYDWDSPSKKASLEAVALELSFELLSTQGYVDAAQVHGKDLALSDDFVHRVAELAEAGLV